VTSAQSFGPNRLIKQGAKLVDNWMGVFEEFPAAARAQLLPPAKGTESERRTQPLFEPAPASGLSEDQQAV
jgi:predicted Rossmann fold nucleotide-binding protein DprA/Smf involved in DNA uptake